MTTELAIKNRIKFSCDGDCYSVPENRNSEFNRLDEEVQNTEVGSGEWFAAKSEFDLMFASCLKA